MSDKVAILCVDDENVVLESLKEQLKRHFSSGYQIELAESAEEALEICDDLTEDGIELCLVVSDYMMPGMKGDEFLQIIHERLPKILNILLTGQANLEGVTAAINHANLYRYIAKPWEETDLILTLTEAIRRYQQEKEIAQKRIDLEKAYHMLKRLNESYARFVPKEYLGFLQKESILDVRLGDHVAKEMTVMFSDIRDFTQISESMTPQENFDFVNDYFKDISPIIRKHHGIIVKFLGDGMMAVFSNVMDAVQAGIEKAKQVSAYNMQQEKNNTHQISIGLGIHVGYMMVGMIGESNRMQGDAFSDNVNLTARIESLTKYYNIDMIISGETFTLLQTENENNPSVHVRLLDTVVVKGRKTPIALYEVLDCLAMAEKQIKIETMPDFENAVKAYQHGEFEKSQLLFENVLKRNPHDTPAKIYLERIELLKSHDLPADWDGVTWLTDK